MSFVMSFVMTISDSWQMAESESVNHTVTPFYLSVTYHFGNGWANFLKGIIKVLFAHFNVGNRARGGCVTWLQRMNTSLDNSIRLNPVMSVWQSLTNLLLEWNIPLLAHLLKCVLCHPPFLSSGLVWTWWGEGTWSNSSKWGLQWGAGCRSQIGLNVTDIPWNSQANQEFPC